MNSNALVVTQITSALMDRFNVDPTESKSVIESILANYDLVNIAENAALSDLPEKIKFFLDTRRLDGLSDKTIKAYKSELNIFSQRCSKSVDQITINDLRGYISDSQPLKRTTTNNKVTILRTFFQFLAAEEILIKNPSVKLRTLRVDLKSLRQELDEEELETLRNACKTPKERAIVEFFVSSGCRVSEVTKIKISEIDWNERSLTVVGKGNKSRRVYFSVKAKMLLRFYIGQRKGDCDALFCSDRAPYHAISKDQLEKIVRSIAARTDIKKPTTCHVLRHTYATILLQRGCSITIIQQLLGHESVNTTQIYATTSEQMLKRAYEQYSA